jgi:hypothetical protein
MEAKDQIILEIKRIVMRFPTLKVRYENDFLSNSHFIEVSSSGIFDFQDKEYLDFIEEVTFRFIKIFPLQNISFILEDDLVGIDIADIELKGILYQSMSGFDLYDVSRLEVGNIYSSNFHSGSLNNKMTNSTYSNAANQPLTLNFLPVQSFEVNMLVGESNYALAA